MSASTSRFMTNELRTCLVYHIGKCLCVVPKETTDRVARTVTREGGLNQGREFVQSERTFDRTSTGCVSELRRKKQEVFSVLCKTTKAGLETYRSRIQKSYWYQRAPGCALARFGPF